MTSRLLISLIVIGIVFPLKGQSSGNWATVTGRVLDAENKPVEGARISLFPMDVAISGGMPRGAISDEKGQYRLATPAFPGKTRLCAVKEVAGYPDTNLLLFVSGNENMPEISLSPGAVLGDVDIHLGTPNGVLEGNVLDANTGKPVSRARISLTRANPKAMHSTTIPPDGHFFFALPQAPIEVSVTAPGYRPWVYKTPRTRSKLLVLGSTEHKLVTIELVPAN